MNGNYMYGHAILILCFKRKRYNMWNSEILGGGGYFWSEGWLHIIFILSERDNYYRIFIDKMFSALNKIYRWRRCRKIYEL